MLSKACSACAAATPLVAFESLTNAIGPALQHAATGGAARQNLPCPDQYWPNQRQAGVGRGRLLRHFQHCARLLMPDIERYRLGHQCCGQSELIDRQSLSCCEAAHICVPLSQYGQSPALKRSQNLCFCCDVAIHATMPVKMVGAYIQHHTNVCAE